MEDQVRLIELPKLMDERGNLSFIENSEWLPFDIARVFWTYDVPGGQVRGGHAYRSNREVIIALSGSFDVVLYLNGERKVYSLNRSYYGIYIPALVWRHLENFSTNSMALTIASEAYSKDDYIRSLELYEQAKS